MLPGDSLVDRIFEQGIGSASAFVIVLSHSSVVRKWVREELNAAIVSRIERGAKLIPVLIDDVQVPESLKSTVWIRIEDVDEYDEELATIVSAVFEKRERPPLGPVPAFAESGVPEIVGLTQADSIVLKCICETEVEIGYNSMMHDQIIASTSRYGLSPHIVDDALELLDGRGFIDGTRAADGMYVRVQVTSFGFESYSEAFRPTIEDEKRTLASYLVNELPLHQHASTVDLAKDLDIPISVLDHLVESFELRSYVSATKMAQGYLVGRPTVELRRSDLI
jgi:hypothetical protein